MRKFINKAFDCLGVASVVLVFAGLLALACALGHGALIKYNFNYGSYGLAAMIVGAATWFTALVGFHITDKD